MKSFVQWCFLVSVILINSAINTARAKTPRFGQETNDPDSTGLIAAGARPVLVSDQFSFTEGPASDKAGNVFFTDQPNNKIWKYSTGGNLSVFMDSAGRANGLFFDDRGNLFACADKKNEIWCISPSGKVKVILTDVGGLKLNGPNDLWIRPHDNIYFTDPYYQRDYWERTKPEITGQKVYYLPNKKKEAIVVADDLEKPNGIIGTPDGKKLYVADIGASKTYVYEINDNGMLANKKLFAEQGSDGMTIDNKGNIYLTGHGVTVYDPDGKKILQIPIDANWTANVCFGGVNHDVLFITASKALYTLQMNVRGAE